MTGIARAAHGKHRESCAVGPAKFSGSCVNAWKDKAIQWRTNERPERQIRSAKCQSVEILELDKGDRSNRMGLVQCGYVDGKTDVGWVNLDSLECSGANNVENYSAAGGGSCPPPNALPLQAKVLSESTRPARSSGADFLKRAEDAFIGTQQRAQGDQAELVKAYDGFTDSEAYDRLLAADGTIRKEFAKAALVYGPECEQSPKDSEKKGINKASLTQGQRTCRILRDSLALTTELLQCQNQPELEMCRQTSPEDLGRRFRQLITGSGISFSEIPYDQLALRTVLYNGLRPGKERDAVASKLRYRREATELYEVERTSLPSRADRPARPFVELHNGYVFGGRNVESGMDCSHFIAGVLSVNKKLKKRIDGKKPNFTTYYMQQVARAVAREGRKPDAPWDALVDCFENVDLRKGRTPEPGDIVVSRADGEGHVVLVKSYDPLSGTVKTIEATGGKANTVTREMERPLFEPACKMPEGVDEMRPVRPDVYVLHYNPGPGCPLASGNLSSN